MKLSTLVAELNDPSTRWLSRTQKPVEIYSYEPYLSDSVLRPGIVYVCQAEALPVTIPPEISFLCTGTCEDGPVRFRNCNIVLFNADIMTLLRDAGIQMTIEHKLQNDKQTLMEALNSGKGVQNLIDCAYGMIRTPIIVVDSAYKILAMNSSVIEDRPDLEQQRELGHMMDINVNSMRQQHVYEKTRQNKYPYYSVEPTTHVGWLTALIYVYGIEAAQMGVMEHGHEFTHYDYELTHFLSQLISFELQKDDFYKNNQAMMHSKLLADLLNGRLRDAVVLSRVRQMGWTLTDAMYVLTIYDRNYGAFDHKAQLICEQIHQMFKSSRWVILDSKIAFLIILSLEEDRDSGRWSTLSEYLSANKLSASISDRFSDLFAVRWNFAQCEAAHTLGMQLNPGSDLFFYEDYQVHHIGSAALKELPAGVIFHPGIVAMDKYDREKGTEFKATLMEYFRQIGDPGAAAAKLFIHKNTLFYRINKAKELFSLNLNDGYERLRMYLTMILMEL